MHAMTEIDTSKASREFDAWIAENVMGWRKVNISTNAMECWYFLSPSNRPILPVEYWMPTERIDEAWRMEESLAERNLWREYAGYLCNIVGYSSYEKDGIRTVKADPWNIAHASPLQRCQAAYTMLCKG
jgi:hypothetical protein